MSDAEATTDKLFQIEMPRLSAGDDDEGDGATLASWLVAVRRAGVEAGCLLARVWRRRAVVQCGVWRCGETQAAV